jgi:hypothetical protein
MECWVVLRMKNTYQLSTQVYIHFLASFQNIQIIVFSILSQFSKKWKSKKTSQKFVKIASSLKIKIKN